MLPVTCLYMHPEMSLGAYFRYEIYTFVFAVNCNWLQRTSISDLPTYKITFAGQNVKFCRILQIFAGHPHPIHTTLVIIIMNLQFESVMIAIAS